MERIGKLAEEALARPPTSRRVISLAEGKGSCEGDAGRVAAATRGIPSRYAAWRLVDYPAAVERVRQWTDGPAWSLYIEGGLGTRKTSLAAAIVVAARLGGCRAVFAPLDVTIRMVRSCCDWWLDQARECDLLALDDLGAARDTPHYHETVGALLMHRYDREAKTLVTSNVPLAGLAEAFDPRIADRLREGLTLYAGADSKRRDGEGGP